jgi:RNA polymerase sigma-70 factor (ECF subfamily)
VCAALIQPFPRKIVQYIQKTRKANLETALIETAVPDVAEGEFGPEEFETIVRENQRRIYRLLLALLRDSDEADNLTQECFLRAFRKRASFRGEAGVATWLTRIAINLAFDRGRSRRLAFWKQLRRGQDNAVQTVIDKRQTPEESLLAQERAGAVWSMVGRLPDRQRAVFVLRFAEEMQLDEIASAMDLDIGTVKTHLWHATRAVRGRLRRQD